jgi:hypothetical protein
MGAPGRADAPRSPGIRQPLVKRLQRDSLLPAVQRAAYLVGRASSQLRGTPDVLICGAQRCGTTSMYQSLRQHPAVLRPVARKGVHYFDDVTYVNGLGWYRAHFPSRTELRRRAQRLGEPTVVFESSPYYLFHPAAPARIAAALPAVKALVLLRDPVERAYSAYTHEFRRGYETQSFERALELEDERLDGEEERLLADPGYASHAHRHQAYVRRGRYIDQIVRLSDALGRENLLVVDADDFFTNPMPVWEEVRAFLGLFAFRPHFEQHNARPRTPLPDPMREKLRIAYADDDVRLARWWGRTPSWRRDA